MSQHAQALKRGLKRLVGCAFANANSAGYVALLGAQLA